MELIITDGDWNELGELGYTSADFAYGVDENNFEVVLSTSQFVPRDYADTNYLIYSEDGEIGGVVRGFKVSPDGVVSLTGVTWTGLIGEHILMPPSGSAYFTASGDVATIAATLMSVLGLSDVVTVTGSTGVTVTHTFAGRRDENQQDSGRYMDGWSALWQLLYEHGCKVRLAFDPSTRKVIATILERDDHSDEEELDVSSARVSAKASRYPNHLVCLGQGELASRTIVHLYADADGNVSQTQTMTGLMEYAMVYDDSSAEDSSELIRQGTAKLKELISDATSVGIDVPDNVVYDVGDIVGGTDERSGFSPVAVIVKKIVRINGLEVTREYKTSMRG